MSCETNANKISQSLTVAGVSRSAGKGAYAHAATMRKLGKVGALVGVAAAGTVLSAAALHPKATKRKVTAAKEKLSGTTAPARQTLSTAKATVARHVTTAEEAVATAGQKSAPVAGALLKGINTIERTGFPRGVAIVALSAAGLSPMKVARLGKLAGQATAAAINPAADLSRQSLSSAVVQKKRVLLFFNKKTSVQVWNSSAGKLLNRADRPVPGQNILAEKSAMLKINGVSWHRGTVTFRTPDGKKRTLTHLQSLNLPAQHYYFNRPLSDKETAGLLTRQPGFRPEGMNGYLGQVSPTESLSPGWAEAKHGLIKTAALGSKDVTPARHTPRVPVGAVKDAARTAKQTFKTAKQVVQGDK